MLGIVVNWSLLNLVRKEKVKEYNLTMVIDMEFSKDNSVCTGTYIVGYVLGVEQ